METWNNKDCDPLIGSVKLLKNCDTSDWSKLSRGHQCAALADSFVRATEVCRLCYLQGDAVTLVRVVCSVDVSSGVDIHSSSKSAFKSKQTLVARHNSCIVSLWKESMCFANAVVAAANLWDNLYIQLLIKEHGYAWVTSSKVPGGCGKGPAI